MCEWQQGLALSQKSYLIGLVSTLTDLYMEIAQALGHDPMMVVEPIFWQAKAGHLLRYLV
jgi:hypothetical protein